VTYDEESRRLAGLKHNLGLRSQILQATRAFFVRQGFIEIETPVRVSTVAPEQFIVPISTESWFLSTSPELHMKRLLAAGYDKLFQICKCFRKGEIGKNHNPEFTMIEWYRIRSGYHDVIQDTCNLVTSIAASLGMGRFIPYNDISIDISLPWDVISVREAFSRSAGWDPITDFDAERFDLDLVSKVIPKFDPKRPVILQGYPTNTASLSRLNSQDPRVAERAEVFIAGLEIANAYSELNDREEQRKRFNQEIELIRQSGRQAEIPSRFIDCLDLLPDCGGIALGFDRLVMLFCNTDTIRNVIAFPEDVN
jgi:elongation factor P--(R)-beta-lysine ligase